MFAACSPLMTWASASPSGAMFFASPFVWLVLLLLDWLVLSLPVPCAYATLARHTTSADTIAALMGDLLVVAQHSRRSRVGPSIEATYVPRARSRATFTRMRVSEAR